ncbi:hypothetical protein BwSF19_75590 [Bradyrhizobium ottawaense]|nr:hypothetical protein BwSF19_75590 [Bradyrhizobium ottawaense]
MSFLQDVLIVLMLAGAGTAVFAKGGSQDPKPKSQCLVNASELPSGTPKVMCPTRSSPGGFCVCPRFTKDGEADGHFVGTAR